MTTEPKGAYNRAPIFIGENYGYWKACMHIHMNSVDKGVWDVITNGPNQIQLPTVKVPSYKNWKHNGMIMIGNYDHMIGRHKIFSYLHLVLMNIIMFLIVKPPNLCGMH